LTANFNYLQGEITTLQVALPSVSAFSARQTVAQSVLSGLGTGVIFDQEDFDLGNEYSTTTGIFKSATGDVGGRQDMKLKIEIDLGLSPSAKKWSVRLGVPVVLLVAGGIAFAGLPGGYADGQPLTAEALTNNFNYLQNEITTAALGQRVPSAFQAQLSGSIVVSSGSAQVVLFDQVKYDLASEYASNSGQFVPKNSGVYAVQCSFLIAPSPVAPFEADIETTGGELASTNVENNGGGNITASAIVQLSANQPVWCQLLQTSGSQFTIPAEWPDRKSFSAARLY
jgi:hypothetical protein